MLDGAAIVNIKRYGERGLLVSSLLNSGNNLMGSFNKTEKLVLDMHHLLHPAVACFQDLMASSKAD